MSDNQVQASATVYLASFAALLGALSMGLALGYTSLALLDMERDTVNPILDPEKKEAEKSSIGSALAIGALVGGILGEPCNKFFGRRLSLIIYGGPFILGWLLMALANGLTMLIIGRLLTGLCCGLVSGTAPTYVVEIAPPQIRGFLGTCFQVMVVIGILLAAVFGSFLSWKMLAGICVVGSVGMSGLMLLMPETPQWLLMKGRADEAEASLRRLRNSPINDELNAMTLAATTTQNSATQYSWEVIRSKEFYKPFLLALALMFFQQFSGINAVLFYQSDIFKKATPNSDPATSTIIVFAAQVVATILGSVLVDKLGRRILLLASGVGHSMSLITFGFYSYLSSKHPNDSFQSDYAWVALASLIVFISSFSIGYGPIPWMMIPELSSSRVRSMVASIGTAFNWASVYVVTGFVKTMIENIGDDWTYWTFASICIISCLFVLFFLPETKGKTSEQIQLELLGQQQEQAHLTLPVNNNSQAAQQQQNPSSQSQTIL